MTEELIQAVSASAGGMASTLLLFPLDVIKTKMQASRRALVEEQDDKTSSTTTSGNDFDNSSGTTATKSTLNSSSSSGSSSALAVACELSAGGSIRPFFSGVGPGLVQSGIEKGIYFYAYTFLKAFWASRMGCLSTASTLLLGYAADFTHLPVSLALDTVVKTMQTAKPEKPGAPRPGPAQVAAQLYHTKGLSGFYKGLAAYLVLCLRPAIQFAVFERLKALKLAARKKTSGATSNLGLSALEAFVLGALARAVATVAVYPYTRAKVMAQVSTQARGAETTAAAAATAAAVGETSAQGSTNDDDTAAASVAASADTASTPSSPPPPPLPVPQTLLASMHTIFAEDGIAGLFHGLGPEVFRGMLSGAVMLMVKEKIENATRLALQGKTKSLEAPKAPLRATA